MAENNNNIEGGINQNSMHIFNFEAPNNIQFLNESVGEFLNILSIDIIILQSIFVLLLYCKFWKGNLIFIFGNITILLIIKFILTIYYYKKNLSKYR